MNHIASTFSQIFQSAWICWSSQARKLRNWEKWILWDEQDICQSLKNQKSALRKYFHAYASIQPKTISELRDKKNSVLSALLNNVHFEPSWRSLGH